MNPVAAITHLLGIAAGVIGGLALAAWATPDLPSPDTKPGVELPKKLANSSSASYYRPGNFAKALGQASEQFPDGEQIISLSLQSDQLQVTTSSGSNTVSAQDVPVNAPQRMIPGINRLREQSGAKPVTLDDVQVFSFAAANPRDQSWYALLDITKTGPPTEYWGSFDGTHVRLR